MNKIFFKSIVAYILICALFSCENKELSHPETIKGMQLGLDYDSQCELGEQNGICENDLPEKSICQYSILGDIYARPSMYYSLFNGEQVLAEVKLTLNSPTNFPSVEDEEGNIIAEYPSLTKSEVNDVIEIYTKKYGKGEVSEWEYGATYDWIIGDLFIRLQYSETTYAYGYQLHPQIKDFFQDNAYYVEIKYSYDDSMKKLLKNEKTYNDDPIGDKI
jgi:hypothetical protein